MPGMRRLGRQADIAAQMRAQFIGIGRRRPGLRPAQGCAERGDEHDTGAVTRDDGLERGVWAGGGNADGVDHGTISGQVPGPLV